MRLRMTLSKITKGTRKADVTLIFDDGSAVQVLNDVANKKMLKEGMQLSEQQLDQLLDENQLFNALKKGYDYLSYGDLTERRMREKLHNYGVSDENIEKCIEYFIDRGYIDDERYATRYAALAVENKLWGERRIVEELLKRGIELSLARETVEQLDQDWEDNAHHIIETKYYFINVSQPRQKQKLVNSLVRMGYTYDQINTAINRYFYEM